MRQKELWLATILCVIACGGVDSSAAVGDIYWTTLRGRSIKHSDPTSLALVEKIFLSGLSVTRGIAVDVEGEKVYWGGKQPDGIFRANLDGTGDEVLIQRQESTNIPYDIAIDPRGGTMYFTDRFANDIFRANLDGTNVQVLVDGPTGGAAASAGPQPRGLAIDFENNKLYWADEFDRVIRRSNLDGTDIEDVLTENVTNIRAMVVMPAENN